MSTFINFINLNSIIQDWSYDDSFPLMYRVVDSRVTVPYLASLIIKNVN